MADEDETSRAKRKPKRRAMDAHFWGMSDAEIASIKASLAADAAALEDKAAEGGVGDKDATEEADEDEQQQQEQEEQQEPIPEGQLPKEEIEARRRILHTDWRMAAFSQFAHCFPHLCIKDFNIRRLERDLEGTDPGSYVGEVISRLLYHLTKDSQLAGKSPDKPWLIRLRREFLRRDPEHNSLGDGPLYAVGGDDYAYDEEDEDIKPAQHTALASAADTPYTGAGTPDVDQSGGPAASTSAVAPPLPAATASTATTGPVHDASAIKAEAEEGEPSAMTLAQDADTATQAETEVYEEKPSWLAEFPNSKGWEDLTLKEQIYALWSCTEWHLTNAEKFKNILYKYRIDDEQPAWRVEPIGADKDFSNYWMFDDYRLWVERETPLRREQRILLEQTAARQQAREKARQKRIRQDQRMRMKALHDRRRQRMAAQRAAEENLDRELQQMEEEEKAEAAASGKSRGKRKRTEAEEKDDAGFGEGEDNSQGTRVSSRISRARQDDRTAPRASRRRSTRNASSTNLSQPAPDGDEEWQQLPPEWIKSEQEEREDDPDFGQENGAASASESELSMLEDEDGDMVKAPTRASQRRKSPRKVREPPRAAQSGSRSKVKAKGTTDESELSELSDVDGMSLDEAEPEEEEDEASDAVALEDPTGNFPDSAWESYNGLPSFDDEDKDLPEDFIRWELVIQDLPEWLDIEQKLFPETQDVNERALITWVEQYVQPRVRDELARRAEVRRKEEVARKAAERKARLALEKSQEASPAPSAAAPANKFRSSRIAQREAREADERAKALAEEKVRQAEEAARNPASVQLATAGQGEVPENEAEKKIVESDRRAARARQREEDRKAREEAELAAALRESAAEEGDQPDVAKPVPQDALPTFKVPAPDQAYHEVAPQSMGLPAGTSSAAPAILPTVVAAPPQPLQEQPISAPAPVADAAADVVMEESGADDYFLDCSVCKKRGINLDPNSQLVACDNCDRWEHVRCHHKADEKAGRTKRDFDQEDFLCEDCEEIETSVVLPSAPKRERSEKEKLGAKKGAAKRKAKAAAERAKKAAASGANGATKPAAVARKASAVGAPSSGPVAGGPSIPAPAIPPNNNGSSTPSGTNQVQPRGEQHPAAIYNPQPLPAQVNYGGQAIGGPVQQSQTPFHMPSPSVQSPSLVPQQGMRSPSFQPVQGHSPAQYSAPMPQFQQHMLPPHLQQYSQAMFPQGRQIPLQSGMHVSGQQPGQSWPPQQAFPPQNTHVGMPHQYAYANQTGLQPMAYQGQAPQSMQGSNAGGNFGSSMHMPASYPGHPASTGLNSLQGQGQFSSSHHFPSGQQGLQTQDVHHRPQMQMQMLGQPQRPPSGTPGT